MIQEILKQENVYITIYTANNQTYILYVQEVVTHIIY